MDLQKLNVKLFIEPSSKVALVEFIDVFHGWIQATDGVYHDVADYSHMQAGPGVVLVANDVNVSIEETENRRGLLFSQKSRLDGSNQEKLRVVFRSALENCRKLEEEPALRGKLHFTANEAVVSLNDRLAGSNSRVSYEAIKGEIETLVKQLYGAASVIFERNDDPRQRLNVRIKADAVVDVRQALEIVQRH
ncbi:MAG TPA: hypothetical protein VLA17_16305 [Candidatus Limnocylindria bacterium]|nr:hypothetical protein [Candidatus Limnocylindria bacterium]